MIPKHVTRTLTLSAATFFMVLQFQNCAPASQATRMKAEAEDPNADSPVYAIDNPIEAEALVFDKPRLDVATQASVASVTASCSSSVADAALEWKLLDPNGGPAIVKGFTECINGQLQIDIEPAQMLACNLVYQLSVATSDESAQSVTVLRSCP